MLDHLSPSHRNSNRNRIDRSVCRAVFAQRNHRAGQVGYAMLFSVCRSLVVLIAVVSVSFEPARASQPSQAPTPARANPAQAPAAAVGAALPGQVESGADANVSEPSPAEQQYEALLKNLNHPAVPESMRMILVDGRIVTGEISAMTVDGVRLSGQETRISFNNMVRMEATLPGPLPSVQPQVILSNGDSLSAEIVSLSDDSLTVRWTRFDNWPLLKLPLDVVRGAVVQSVADRRLLADERVAMNRYTDRNDLLRFLNGDSLSGEIDSIDDSVVRMKTPAGDRQINRTELRSIAFNPDLLSEPAQSNSRQHLVSLVDGSQLHVQDPLWLPEGAVRCRLYHGAEITVSATSILSWRPLGGRAVYLSELKPVRSRFVPYGALDWAWQADRNVLSQPLAIRGVDFPRGIGMHSQSEIEFAVTGNYESFQATVGIDDAAAQQGIAAVSVLLDAKVVWSDTVSAVAGPVSFRIEIPPAAQSLTLSVDYGPNGDIGDHVDFVDAVLIRPANASAATPRRESPARVEPGKPAKAGKAAAGEFGPGKNASGKSASGTGRSATDKTPTRKPQS